MRTVHFIDTSVMVELLNIPGMNTQHEAAKKEYDMLVEDEDSFVLPVATLIETGNHIAHIPDGRKRFEIANKFTNIVKRGIGGEENWNVVPEIPLNVLERMMEQFPEQATVQTGLGDIGIIEQFEDFWKKRQPIGRMRIWSFDTHLAGYCREGGLSRRRDK